MQLTIGASIKYVTLFLANFDPLSPVTLCHTSRDPPKVRHTSRDPPIYSRPSTKILDKSPLYKFYFSCSRRILSGDFVRVGFCPFPLLQSQYICYNRKLYITLNFKKLYKRDVTCSLPPSPPVTNCHTFSDPPLERDLLYGRPLTPFRRNCF